MSDTANYAINPLEIGGRMYRASVRVKDRELEDDWSRPALPTLEALMDVLGADCAFGEKTIHATKYGQSGTIKRGLYTGTTVRKTGGLYIIAHEDSGREFEVTNLFSQGAFSPEAWQALWLGEPIAIPQHLQNPLTRVPSSKASHILHGRAEPAYLTLYLDRMLGMVKIGASTLETRTPISVRLEVLE